MPPRSATADTSTPYGSEPVAQSALQPMLRDRRRDVVPQVGRGIGRRREHAREAQLSLRRAGARGHDEPWRRPRVGVRTAGSGRGASGPSSDHPPEVIDHDPLHLGELHVADDRQHRVAWHGVVSSQRRAAASSVFAMASALGCSA